MKSLSKPLLISITFLFQMLLFTDANAQSIKAKIYGEDDEFPFILDINWLNERFLSKQRVRVEEITRRHFGKQLQIGKNNFSLLQRIVDEEIIEGDDTLHLQALGVVLGDIYVESHKALNWKVYHDQDNKTGNDRKSHAVCIDDTKHCLFPVTMLSRRMEVGIKPNVKTVYDKGMKAIKSELPKRAYFD